MVEFGRVFSSSVAVYLGKIRAPLNVSNNKIAPPSNLEVEIGGDEEKIDVSDSSATLPITNRGVCHRWRLVLIPPLASVLLFVLFQLYCYTFTEDPSLLSALLASYKLHRDPEAYWNGYRLSDGVKMYRRTPGCKYYPNTILCEYTERTNIPNEIDVLTGIIKERRKGNTPGQDFPLDSDIVIHLRVGDGLCSKHDYDLGCNVRDRNGSDPDCFNFAQDCFQTPWGGSYGKPKAHYENILMWLPPPEGRRIVVIANPSHHTGRSVPQSNGVYYPDNRNGDYSIDYQYCDNVANFFRENGFDVLIRVKTYLLVRTLILLT